MSSMLINHNHIITWFCQNIIFKKLPNNFYFKFFCFFLYMRFRIRYRFFKRVTVNITELTKIFFIFIWLIGFFLSIFLNIRKTCSSIISINHLSGRKIYWFWMKSSCIIAFHFFTRISSGIFRIWYRYHRHSIFCFFRNFRLFKFFRFKRFRFIINDTVLFFLHLKFINKSGRHKCIFNCKIHAVENDLFIRKPYFRLCRVNVYIYSCGRNIKHQHTRRIFSDHYKIFVCLFKRHAACHRFYKSSVYKKVLKYSIGLWIQRFNNIPLYRYTVFTVINRNKVMGKISSVHSVNRRIKLPVSGRGKLDLIVFN